MTNASQTSNGQLSPGTRRRVLAVMCLALATVVSSLAGLNVALPSLAEDTGASQSELQWLVNAYALVFAALLLPAGALGDRYGRKGVLLAGLGIFGLAATGALLTNDPPTLIGLRAAMGVGAALVMPATLSLITSVFPPEERPRAVSVWVGVAGASGALGLLASGTLLEWFSWSSFFVLSVALAALAILGTVAAVPTSRDPGARLDAPGALLATAGLAALVYGIIEGPERGWGDTLTLSALAAGLAILAAFFVWELRARQPMLDPRLFRLPGFAAGAVSITVQFFAMFGFFFVALQYLQFVLDYSPLEAGAAMLPLPLTMIPLARRTPALAARLGIRMVGALGLALIATAFVILSLLEVDSTYWHIAGALVVLGAGMAFAGVTATEAMISALPRDRQGVASGINSATREVGGALGIAVLGSFVNDGYRSGVESTTSRLPDDVAGRAEESLAFVKAAGPHFGARGQELIAHAQGAFVDGLSTALLVGAGVVALGAAYVALRAPGRGETPVEPSPGDDRRAAAEETPAAGGDEAANGHSNGRPATSTQTGTRTLHGADSNP